MTDTGQPIDCRVVVLATGAFQRPAIPTISKQLSHEVLQLSPEGYKAPGQLPDGRVLVGETEQPEEKSPWSWSPLTRFYSLPDTTEG
jgi:hypothetical protein